MDYMKDGKKRTGFHPTQDLAGDQKGQEQASRVARGSILRIALGKLTQDESLIQVLMAMWNKKPLENEQPMSMDILLTDPPPTFSDKEKGVFLELRRLVVGY